ncbi:hypothetical protein, partial [Paenibacillus sp. Y412MC10]|uniref:hypothetical protein n=1 Tax=Geobacillus sp. (strain Y412MC10) TaxID=481743 RepID=UPI001C92FDA6
CWIEGVMGCGGRGYVVMLEREEVGGIVGLEVGKGERKGEVEVWVGGYGDGGDGGGGGGGED